MYKHFSFIKPSCGRQHRLVPRNASSSPRPCMWHGLGGVWWSQAPPPMFSDGRGHSWPSPALFYECAHLGAIKRKKCIMLNADEPCAKQPSYRRPHDLHAAELIATSSSLHMQWTHPAATRTGLALFLGVDILLEQHDDILLEQPKTRINQAA